MFGTDLLIGDLDTPWDAEWLAARWPHLFSVMDAQRGTIVIHDVPGVLALASETHLIDLEFDGSGLTLRVFNGSAQLASV